MTEVQQCATCRWGWETDSDDDTYMQCHRYAPRPAATGAYASDVAHWPLVRPNAGCGDWTTRYL